MNIPGNSAHKLVACFSLSISSPVKCVKNFKTGAIMLGLLFVLNLFFSRIVITREPKQPQPFSLPLMRNYFLRLFCVDNLCVSMSAAPYLFGLVKSIKMTWPRKCCAVYIQETTINERIVPRIRFSAPCAFRINKIGIFTFIHRRRRRHKTDRI